MPTIQEKATFWIMLATCCSFVLGVGLARADEETSLLLKPPAVAKETDAAGPALPPPSNPNARSGLPTSESVAAPQLPPRSERASAGPGVKRPFMRPAQPLGAPKGRLVAQQPTLAEPGVAGEAVPGSQPLPPPASPAVLPQELQPTPSLAPQPLAPQPALQPMPAQAPQAEVHVRRAPPIKYDTDRDARRMYRSGSMSVIAQTQNPLDGCAYEIPLCVPACCGGEPEVTCGRGLLGRGVVEYCWPCGFRAIVKFRPTLGDVRVDYEGD